jgi:hypothetical protein
MAEATMRPKTAEARVAKNQRALKAAVCIEAD